ncbi:MAG: RidA family protein [Gammaproteobacteria bacterium]
MKKRKINPWAWQDRLGFVQANEVTNPERILYCSGQTSVDADGRLMHPDDMKGQLNQALDNVVAVLNEAGMDLSNVTRLNVYTTDVDALMEVHDDIVHRFDEAGGRHAGTLVGVTRLAFPGMLVELEATAVA